jgi:thioesterase domain-containing protein
MTMETLLAELRRRDVGLSVHGSGLRCTAPTGALTSELREEILCFKSEIVAVLGSAETIQGAPRAIVPLEPRGDLTPVFGVPCSDGDVFCYGEFVRALQGGRPFFALDPPGLDGCATPLARIEDLAAYFAEQIAAFRPSGPLIVAGYNAGGAVAFELGRRLVEAGRSVLFVALFGSPYPSWYRGPAQVSFRVGRHARALLSAPGESLRYVADSVLRLRSRREASSAAALDPVLGRRQALNQVTLAAVRRYKIRPFPGRLALFLPHRRWLPSSVLLWRAAARETRVYAGPVDSTPETMLSLQSADVAALFRLACGEHETYQRYPTRTGT